MKSPSCGITGNDFLEAEGVRGGVGCIAAAR